MRYSVRLLESQMFTLEIGIKQHTKSLAIPKPTHKKHHQEQLTRFLAIKEDYLNAIKKLSE